MRDSHWNDAPLLDPSGEAIDEELYDDDSDYSMAKEEKTLEQQATEANNDLCTSTDRVPKATGAGTTVPPKLLFNNNSTPGSRGTDLVARTGVQSQELSIQVKKRDCPAVRKFDGKNVAFFVCIATTQGLFPLLACLNHVRDMLESVYCRKATRSSSQESNQITCQQQQFEKGKPSLNWGFFPFCTCAIALTCVLVHFLASPALQKRMCLEWYRIFTNMFLHTDNDHLFGNLLSIVLFGSLLENMYGAVTVGFTFLIGHIGAHLMYFQVDGGVGAVGSSAGLYALYGLFYATLWIHWSLIWARLRHECVPDFGILGWWVLVILSNYNGMKKNRNMGHLGGVVYGLWFSLSLLWYSGRLGSNFTRSRDFQGCAIFLFGLGLFIYQSSIFWNGFVYTLNKAIFCCRCGNY